MNTLCQDKKKLVDITDYHYICRCKLSNDDGHADTLNYGNNHRLGFMDIYFVNKWNVLFFTMH